MANKIIESNYHSKCICGEDIEPGDDIVYNDEEGHWVLADHDDCRDDHEEYHEDYEPHKDYEPDDRDFIDDNWRPT